MSIVSDPDAIKYIWLKLKEDNYTETETQNK